MMILDANKTKVEFERMKMFQIGEIDITLDTELSSYKKKVFELFWESFNQFKENTLSPKKVRVLHSRLSKEAISSYIHLCHKKKEITSNAEFCLILKSQESPYFQVFIKHTPEVKR